MPDWGRILPEEELQIPPRLGDDAHRLTVRRCKIVRRRLVPRGDSEVLNLPAAIEKLAPTRTPRAMANVAKARVGHFLGIRKKDRSNFVIINPTRDGDIRWLLAQRPDLANQISEVYLVEDVVIRRSMIDLPVLGADGA